MPSDPLDLYSEEIQRAQAENAQAARDLDQLIHRVYAQNPDGQKLLAHMRRVLVAAPFGSHLTNEALRYRAARADLVLEIDAAIERVESGQ